MQPATGTAVREPTRATVLGRREEAAELRSELARIGVVVRDEKKRQYVRTRSGQ